MTQSFLKRGVILGLLSAIGPFAIDMYLPSLPAIAGDLKATTAGTQATLGAFMIAVACTQIFYGPIADMVGRKPPLYFGLGLFALASIGCILSPSIEWLIAFRFLQGLGACAMMVIPRAVVRDLHTGIEAAKLMSMIMLVFSISPILAPLTGSYIIEVFGWRGVFGAITLTALIGFALVVWMLPETRPPEQRIRSSLRSVVVGYRELLGDRHFGGLGLIGGLGISTFFAFLSTSSFVYMNHFGLSAHQYGLAFAINAVGFFAAAQLTPMAAKRFGFPRMVLTATALFTAIVVALAVLVAAGFSTLALIIPMLMIGFAFLGMVIPSTAVLALEDHGPVAGMASALLGTIQLVCGVAVMGLLGLFFDGTPMPMLGAIAICALGAMTVCWFTLGRRREAVQAPAE
jgi:DHA1 family bicyclomycin/chloramphenicol resistance-like MFS transporter